MEKKRWGRRHPVLRVLAIILGVLLVLGLGTWAAFRWSPWPSALVIRSMFDREGMRVNEALAPRVLADEISEQLDISYLEGEDTRLDVFRPLSAENVPLPTVVWVHGGGWISGDKDQIANYLRILAARGFTVVGVNYTIAPEATYPTPVTQTMAALDYLNTHAEDLGVDANNIVLAGDSAGSQISAQLATLITSPAYARDLGIAPTLEPRQLAATVLTCGAYDLSLADVPGAFSSFLKTVLWSYTGTRDYADDPRTAGASVLNFVTADFPASFITAGNADALLPQSEALATRLDELGVPVDALFYAADHEPALDHEYQFNLGTPEADAALDRIVAFVDAHTGARLQK